MLRAKVNVEVCHVEEHGKTAKKRQTKGKTRAKRKKPKSVDSDWETETAASGWEGEDELNASQYLQGDDPDLALVRKRPAEDTLPGIELGNGPVAKRTRTGGA